jgi:hypothetical protein
MQIKGTPFIIMNHFAQQVSPTNGTFQHNFTIQCISKGWSFL